MLRNAWIGDFTVIDSFWGCCKMRFWLALKSYRETSPFRFFVQELIVFVMIKVRIKKISKTPRERMA